MKLALVVLMSLTVVLAGCVEPPSETVEESMEVVLPTAALFPAWEGVDHTNVSQSEEVFENRSYMAYFSSPLCTHCETTLDAYDLVLPTERFVVFSMDARERLANMSEWHNNTEENLNRTLDRPFILHPALAKEVEARAIPHAVFVNAQGYAFHTLIGKQTNQTYIQSVWDLTETAVFNETTGWNHVVEPSS